MNSRRHLHARGGCRGRGRGQSMVEYLIAAAVLLALIAVPVDGEDSVLVLMLEAIRTAYAKFLGALSLPQ